MFLRVQTIQERTMAVVQQGVGGITDNTKYRVAHFQAIPKKGSPACRCCPAPQVSLYNKQVESVVFHT